MFNVIGFVIGVGGLIAALRLNGILARFYFMWKCVEVGALPVLGVLSEHEAHSDGVGRGGVTTAVLLYNFARACFHLYCAYIIYSFWKRVDRGETLLL